MTLIHENRVLRLEKKKKKGNGVLVERVVQLKIRIEKNRVCDWDHHYSP